MITNLDGSTELFLANVERIQQRLATANRQVSSGKRITTAADAPDEVASLLQLRAALHRNQQIQSNLVLAKADADAADGAMASAVKLLDRALTLAAQGTNTSLSTEARQSIAGEILGIQEQMVARSQTAVQGRYIFSGDRSDTPAYRFDLTSTTYSVVELTGVAATTLFEDPAGGSIAKSKSAQEIFNPRDADGNPLSGNVFAALDGLRNAILSNNTTTIANAIDPIKSAATWLNRMEAFYGTVQSRIKDATDYAAAYDTRLRTEISQKEDADTAAAAVEATAADTQLQAAFQMRARMPHTSLFDYLG
jgi:flagellar hook-associated protein 3 FlgL